MKYVKSRTVLPILIGIIIGVTLFWVGYAEDAPGMCLIGLAAAFLLIMRGVHNTGAVRKGLLTPIILFCFGVGGIFLSVVLLLDGEFEDSPELALIGIAFGIVLIVTGAFRLKKVRGERS